MSRESNQNPSGAIHPTILMLAWVVLTVGLQYFLPITLPEYTIASVSGRVMMVLGGVLIVWSNVVFRKHGTSTDHKNPTTALVTDGPFRLSRNPIYLALILILLGVSITYGNGWGLLLVVPFAVCVQHFTILREEHYLASVFGNDFSRYRETVRRWI